MGVTDDKGTRKFSKLENICKSDKTYLVHSEEQRNGVLPNKDKRVTMRTIQGVGLKDKRLMVSGICMGLVVRG